MSIILPFPTPAQPEARLTCPNCAAIPAQRIDTQVGNQTIASCVCLNGHLFVTEWEVVK